MLYYKSLHADTYIGIFTLSFFFLLVSVKLLVIKYLVDRE